MPKSSSSEASDGEPAPKRQRLVEFEPIRLPSIGSAVSLNLGVYLLSLERDRSTDSEGSTLQGL